MTDQDIALAAARRVYHRQAELHPAGRWVGHGYARDGVEIAHPYCGGDRSTWSPPPGAEYTMARKDESGEVVYTLRQKA